jgi:hypothetical protein
MSQQMDTRRLIYKTVSISVFLWLAACGAPAAPSGTILPPIIPETSPTRSVFIPATMIPADTPIPTITPIPLCVPGLTFVSDVTIPDGTVVAPGSRVDKQWLVQNSGACDWDSRYRLRLVSGTEMGAGDQVLYPARFGTQAVLRILFIAPLDPGSYTGVWQAVAPDGSLFGDVVTITIIVQSP